jgi:hypothetical protein
MTATTWIDTFSLRSCSARRHTQLPLTEGGGRGGLGPENLDDPLSHGCAL